MKKHGNTFIDQKLFIERCKAIHNDFYDYSQVNYENLKSRIKIICPIHGEFEQSAAKHLHGKRGCSKCGKTKLSNIYRDTKESFLKKAEKIHGNQYDYSLVDFINHHTKVKIICPKHGVFEQSVNSHLCGRTCKQCSIEKKITGESFYNFTKERWTKITKEGYFYLVKCTNQNESFYKVGITKCLETRFKTTKNYNIAVIDYLFLDSNTNILWEKEKTFHTTHKSFKYIPELYINGFTECYILSDEIVQNFKNSKQTKT